MTEFLIAGGIMGAMGATLAAVLAFADKKLYVYEDPRIDEVEGLLPSRLSCRLTREQKRSGSRAWLARVVPMWPGIAPCISACPPVAPQHW
jgi:hypothetical protein